VSGALLTAVAILGLFPELIGQIGWISTLLCAGAGYGILAVLDHRGYPVCPSCSHGEKFAGSLAAATAFHAFVDGWGVVAARDQGPISGAIMTAILLHKVPEGMALGAMLRASTRRAVTAVGLCCVAELPTVFGGATGLWAAPQKWVGYPLALVAGTFVFLGLHAIQGAWGSMRPASLER
ncbi:MAG TPA: hypothetical protein VHB50_01685, partial [Bryobacteraceae bacterium]|nr:hypothetical protein [Bryobacteraceae bacterium]